jgi:hypothetical protein
VVSAKQIQFFDTLLGEKQLPPGTDAEGLRTTFATLNKASASLWIEKAMSLPEKGEEHETVTPPSF